jgi:hypothetical protein
MVDGIHRGPTTSGIGGDEGRGWPGDGTGTRGAPGACDQREVTWITPFS